MSTAKRTDPHRPGAIVPADYRAILFYSLPSTEGGYPVPSYRVNCELDKRVTTRDAAGAVASVVNGEHSPDGLCCVIGMRQAGSAFAPHGGTGQCSVCGSHFIEGEIWRHEPSGEHVHVGHQCAAKYELMADWSADELDRSRQRANCAAARERDRKAAARAEFVAAHPGLADALAADHPIVRDISARLTAYSEISDKQIALVRKLADEARNPASVEIKADAPTGRQTFRGVVVSVKSQESDYGVSMRMTVKVTTPAGVWLAWGTAPDSLLGATCNHGGLRGAKVEVTATLTAGRERGFAVMKRPRGRLLVPGCGGAEKCVECHGAGATVAA